MTNADTPGTDAQRAAFEDPADEAGGPPKRGERSARPRDAATLILVRRSRSQPQILMGRRHRNHVFMPGKFVFPGGRVDPGDYRAPAASELRPHVARRVSHRAGPAKARALALAAVRETFEETGLTLGAPCERLPRCRSRSWRPFLERRVQPALEPLDFIARAITPPARTRRFDARFFLADADHLTGATRPVDISGELLELHWLTLDEARKLDLPAITRFVLGELEAHLEDGPDAARPVPFVYYRRGRTVVDSL
ncbi:MAG: NUDIX hydrolase [Alphaproteobacteria bacterium]